MPASVIKLKISAIPRIDLKTNSSEGLNSSVIWRTQSEFWMNAKYKEKTYKKINCDELLKLANLSDGLLAIHKQGTLERLPLVAAKICLTAKEFQLLGISESASQVGDIAMRAVSMDEVTPKLTQLCQEIEAEIEHHFESLWGI